MKRINFGFFVSVLACGIILNAYPLDDLRFALHELGPMVLSDVRFKDQVSEQCGSLASSSATQVEKYVLERLPIPRMDGRPECTLVTAHASATRLRLRSFYDFQVQVRNPDGVPIADRHYTLNFPRPLVLLPLAILLLALVFEFPRWGLGWTVSSYVFLLCAGNLIEIFRSLGQGVRMSFRGEQSWTGLFLILFWVALTRARRLPPTGKGAPSVEGRWLNRGLLGAVGLWNPAAFTLSGRLLLPFQGAVNRLTSFFTAQVAAVALSLYLLSLSFDNWSAFFSDSLLLPRYFTFGALLFMLLEHRRPKREPLVWRLPGLPRMILFVVIAETCAFHFPELDAFSTLTRIGFALVLSQLVWPFDINWKRASQDTLKWGSALMLAAVISVLSQELGVADLALLIFDPRIHPTGVVFFTFLSGLALGFITGNFSVAFFPLFMLLMKSATLPLVKAAMLDGILAGILLSPFSIHNLLPAAQFGLRMPALIAYRFRQLAFPLVIGLLIYAVSAINSVAILRPATFVFLCLVAVVAQLKKGSWKLRHYTISPDLRSGVH